MVTNSGPKEASSASGEDRKSPLPLMTAAERSTDTGVRTKSSSAQLELAFDQRSSAVFRQWLTSLTTDAEAALAAAMSYRELSPAGRDHWLTSIQSELQDLAIPKIAVYAPLLAVEHDPNRRALLEELALGDEDCTEIIASQVALSSEKRNGEKIFVVVVPLYLQFVQVLACAVKDGRFTWVRHDPIVSKVGAPVAGDVIKGVQLELAPFGSVIDDLAACILSHKRQGLELPEALYVLSDLLGRIGP